MRTGTDVVNSWIQTEYEIPVVRIQENGPVKTLYSTTFHAVNVMLPFNHQPHKFVKHTQTIRRLLPTGCLSVSDLFAGMALKGLNH